MRKEEMSPLHLFLFSFLLPCFFLHFVILVSAGEEGVLLTQVLDGENTHCIYMSDWEGTNVR